MASLFRHKLLTLLLIAGIVYWSVNPSRRFGIVRKGFVVYNKIPVTAFDCYIDPEGKLKIQDDLTVPSNLNYWFDEHFVKSKNPTPAILPLLVGTGFDDTVMITFTQRFLNQCTEMRFKPHFLPSREATEQFNTFRNEGIPAAILLKVK